jgi:uncharacterized lipoprotein
MRIIVIATLSILFGLAGCRGESGLRCEDSERYRDSGEMAPVQVPDDLSVPDESEALRVPPRPAEGERSREDSREERGSCLEAPPVYTGPEGDQSS